ncbi:MAG: PHP domain-containing protein [Patescibacteria group bacterium]|jgi:predicted metal-dependent phosphoesterase TrpH
MSTIFFTKPDLRDTKRDLKRMVDFHVHSNYSFDGTIPVGKLLKTARKLNLGLAICDHNEIEGSMVASQQSEVVIIPGIEVNCMNGTHVLLYFETHTELRGFFEKVVKPNKKSGAFVTNLLPGELIEKARGFNCIISMPHPFVLGKGGVQRAIAAGTIKESFIQENVDIIEGINGMASRTQNQSAIDWAKFLNKPMLAGSDGHVIWQIGTVATKVTGTNAKEIYHNLKSENELHGLETGRWNNKMITVVKEMHLLSRKEGIKILSNQIIRNIKKK